MKWWVWYNLVALLARRLPLNIRRFQKGDSMSFEQAAGFAVTYGTSYYALKQRGTAYSRVRQSSS